jgi:hypothetical protein
MWNLFEKVRARIRRHSRNATLKLSRLNIPIRGCSDSESGAVVDVCCPFPWANAAFDQAHFRLFKKCDEYFIDALIVEIIFGLI